MFLRSNWPSDADIYISIIRKVTLIEPDWYMILLYHIFIVSVYVLSNMLQYEKCLLEIMMQIIMNNL